VPEFPADPDAAYLAGGTTQLDLILKDAIISRSAWSTSPVFR